MFAVFAAHERYYVVMLLSNEGNAEEGTDDGK